MANASLTTPPAHPAWGAARRADAELAFRRARRHTRTVRLLRIAIPAGIMGGLALYTLVTWLNPFGGLPGLPTMSKMVVSGSRVTMDLPRMTGYTRDGRAYEMRAAAAAQDLKRPQFIEMKEVRSRVELKDGSVLTVTADNGVYDTKSEVVQLQNNVIVVSSDGTEAHMVEAVIDMRKSHVLSQQPVDVMMKNSRILAKEMEVANAGEVVHFRGGVTMNIKPEPAPVRRPAGAAEARP